jgi:hypothetical protein
MLTRRKEIIMMCNNAGRPVILENVDWSDLGLRERLSHEKVHLKDHMFQHCFACGMPAGVWIKGEGNHAMHRDKCK